MVDFEIRHDAWLYFSQWYNALVLQNRTKVVRELNISRSWTDSRNNSKTLIFQIPIVPETEVQWRVLFVARSLSREHGSLFDHNSDLKIVRRIMFLKPLKHICSCCLHRPVINITFFTFQSCKQFMNQWSLCSRHRCHQCNSDNLWFFGPAETGNRASKFDLGTRKLLSNVHARRFRFLCQVS